MSRTVHVNPLLVLVSILVGASMGSWVGGVFGAFVAALLAIPAAGAVQVIVREVWYATDPAQQPAAGTAPTGTPAAGTAPTGTPAAGTAPAGPPPQPDLRPAQATVTGQQPASREG